MAFSDARNSVPAAIGVSAPGIAAGPNPSPSNAITAFGAVGGAAYEGAVTGNLIKTLREAGNEIATLNSPLVEGAVAPGGNEAVGVSIGRADPTGTVDKTTDRFKRLEQSRLQGLISEQRASLEADVILRESITRAPGFADKLRAAATAELGFNPSGAALNLLYMSGPDANKTVKQTAEDKKLEKATSWVNSGLYPDVDAAMLAINKAEASVAQRETNTLAIQGGELSLPQVVDTATSEFTNKAQGMLLVLTAGLVPGKGVVEPDKWVGQLAILGERIKDERRKDMLASKVPYKTEAFDAVNKAVDAQIATYSKIATDNDFLQVIKDKRDALMTLSQTMAIDMMPDLYGIYFVAGQAGVENYLKVMKLAKGNPKGLAELMENDPTLKYFGGLAAKMPEVSATIHKVFEGGIGAALEDGSITKDVAEPVIRTLGGECIRTQDPTTCGAVIDAANEAGLDNIAVGVAAHTRGSFTQASEKGKVGVKRATLANYDLVKKELASKLSNTGLRLSWDPKKKEYIATDRPEYSQFKNATYTNELYTNVEEFVLGVPTQRPNVDAELEVLNAQVQPLISQPEWAHYVFDKEEFNKDLFINDTVNEVNLGATAAEREVSGSPLATGLDKLPIDQQANINRLFNEGDKNAIPALNDMLRAKGLPIIGADSSVEGTYDATKRLDAGKYEDTNTGRVWMVDKQGNELEIKPANSGTINRGPQFGDLGMGTFQLPANLNPAAFQHINTIKDVWNKEGVDPNIGLAIAFTESSFNPNASNKTKGATAKGLFGFTDGTAEDFDLENSRNAEESAVAAATLFKKLLKRTKGNVFQAVALYHGGRNKDRPDAEDLKYATDVLANVSDESPEHNIELMSF